MKPLSPLGSAIRVIAYQNGGSMAKLGRELGIKSSNFHRYCSGKIKFPDYLLNKIVEKYEIDNEEYQRLKTLQTLSNKSFEVSTDNCTYAQVSMLMALSKSLNSLTDEQVNLIEYVIGKKTN